MSYSIIPVERFRKEAKRLLGKYPSLKSDLARLNEQLLKDPFSGTPLGNNTFKIRLDIRSKGKGKSGGARIITYVVTKNETYISLLSMTSLNLKVSTTIP